MKTRRRLLVSPFALFLLLFAAGFAGTTLLYRLAQSRSMSTEATIVARSPADVTGAQKLFLESRSATSELLFKLAFASLGALLGLRFAEKTRVRVDGHGPFAACGLLLVSIYSAFLFQVGVSYAVEGPLSAMYGPVLSYPISCQFWFLFLAALILAVSLFRPARRVAGALLVLGFGLATPALAHEPVAPYDECVKNWATSRSVELSVEAVSQASRLVERVASLREVALSQGERCDWVTALLDQVRFTAISDGAPAHGAKAGQAVEPLLRSANTATDKPTFTPGELVDRLVALAQIWREPSAIVDIEAGSRTLLVIVVNPKSPKNTWKGYTRWLLRIPPGTYQLSVSDGGRLVERRSLEVRDGDRIPLSLGSKP